MLTDNPRAAAGDGEAAGRFRLIPAIDLLGDEAVRLQQGAYDAVVNRARPLDLARRYAGAGAELIHVVDLDGARSGVIRPALIAEIAAAVAPAAVQTGGGVRGPEDVARLLEAGATRVLLGTVAFAGEGGIAGYVERFGDRVAVSLDIRDGRVAVRGWTGDGMAQDEAVRICREAGVSHIVCTAISRDGTLAGPDCELLGEVRAAFDGVLIAAGGVGSVADVDAVRATGCDGAITGRALMEGRIPLSALA